MGDFNYRNLDWDNLASDQEGERMLQWVQDKGITQHINFPTRGENILDLILSTEPDMVDNAYDNGKIGESDHNIIVCDLCVRTTDTANTVLILDFKKSNFMKFRDSLSSKDWNSLANGSVEVRRGRMGYLQRGNQGGNERQHSLQEEKDQ